MADITRDFPDLLLDAIVSALEAFSSSQSAASRFNVDRDRLRPLGAADLPHVNVWVIDENPVTQRSSARGHVQSAATIYIDCVARADEGDGSPSDEAAVSRLHYLRAQVKHGLFKLANADFGFAAGTVAVREWPRWAMFPRNEEDDRRESQDIAGRLTFTVEYAWQPDDIDHDPLTALAVSDETADMWAAEYALPGGET